MAVASGRFLLRLPPPLHARLRELARRRDSSLNQLCADLLDGSVGTVASPRLNPLGLDASLIASAWRSPLEGLVLFGSAARQETWDTSDVDLLVVLPAQSPATREYYDRWDQSVAPLLRTVQPLSPSFVSYPAGEPGSIWYEAAVDGVVLWDPDLRVSKLLIDLRRRIAEGAIVRRFTHGQPYWVRSGRKA